MKRSEIIDYIKAYAVKFVFGDQASYENVPTTGDLVDEDIPAWKNVNDLITDTLFSPFIYNLPSNSETPIVLNIAVGSIKFGTADPIDITTDLSKLQANPTVLFEVITSADNTSPKPADPWISNKQWSDNTYTLLDVLTIQPDTDTGIAGGLTLDNINIIIKP